MTIHQTSTRFRLGSVSGAGCAILYDAFYSTKTDAIEAQQRLVRKYPGTLPAKIYRVTEIIEEVEG